MGAGRVHAAGRVTLPAPNIGIERYFFDVADTILARIKESRNTVIQPERTGPIADVLYSAAGNSADDQYYRKGIIAYSFEAGSRIFAVNQPTGEITRTDVAGGGFEGFRPPFEPEGRHEAFEFADGNYGLLESALAYARDATPPVVDIDSNGDPRAGAADQLPLRLARRGGGHPLHDRRLDADAGLADVRAQGPRRPGQCSPSTGRASTTSSGSPSTSRATSRRPDADVPDRPGGDGGGTVPATLSLTLGPPASFGAFTPGVDARLHGLDDGERDLDRRRRGALGRRPEHLEHGQARQRGVRAPAGRCRPTRTAARTRRSAARQPDAAADVRRARRNDAVTIGFKQSIGATDALRTGTYSKTLTFTLSTTNP